MTSPRTHIVNTLTSDNLPALLAPICCNTCKGHGHTTPDHPNDPDARIVECEDCGGTGLTPYPGTYAEQTRDFISEVIGPIEQAIVASAQNIRIWFEPDGRHGAGRFYFAMGDVVGDLSASAWDTDLDKAAETTIAQFHIKTVRAAERAQLDADVEAYRKRRAAELGVG